MPDFKTYYKGFSNHNVILIDSQFKYINEVKQNSKSHKGGKIVFHKSNTVEKG